VQERKESILEVREQLKIMKRNKLGRGKCWGFRLPHARTGGVLIFAQRRLSTLTQYFTWFGKSPTSTREVDFIRDTERIQ
jgi:hypothetical protein